MKAGRSFALGHERENVWKLLKLGKLSLSILYVAGMFISELKTKLNVFFFFFFKNGFKKPIEQRSPQGQMKTKTPSKVLFIGKTT